MHRSKARSQQNMQKSRNRIARYKSLETSGMTAIKSSVYGAKERQFASKCGSSVVKEALEVTVDSHHNVSSSTESSVKPDEFESSSIRDEFSSYTGFREIFPSRFLSSANEISSTDEERNIVAMPVEVTREKDTERDLKQLVYGQDFKNQMCMAEKNVLKHNTPYIRHEMHTTKEKTSEKTEDNDRLNMMKRPMIPDGSYIVSKENYIISKQGRLPQEIIEEGRLRADRWTSAIAAGSTVSEVVDNTKLIRYVTTVCLVVCALALTCVVWYWLFKLVPTSGPKKKSLLRYYIDKSYEALLEIYE